MEALAHETVREIVAEIVVGEVESADGGQQAYDVCYAPARLRQGPLQNGVYDKQQQQKAKDCQCSLPPDIEKGVLLIKDMHADIADEGAARHHVAGYAGEHGYEDE